MSATLSTSRQTRRGPHHCFVFVCVVARITSTNIPIFQKACAKKRPELFPAFLCVFLRFICSCRIKFLRHHLAPPKQHNRQKKHKPMNIANFTPTQYSCCGQHHHTFTRKEMEDNKSLHSRKCPTCHTGMRYKCV